jgi:hypothetical protein
MRKGVCRQNYSDSIGLEYKRKVKELVSVNMYFRCHTIAFRPPAVELNRHSLKHGRMAASPRVSGMFSEWHLEAVFPLLRDRPRFYMDQVIKFRISRKPMAVAGMSLYPIQQRLSHTDRYGFDCCPAGIAGVQNLCC